ncbi:MAG: tetratricopeptide repeat protein [Nitrospira sp.]|nr:tetratricopeptide repeat protein [Nitrospira sp.]
MEEAAEFYHKLAEQGNAEAQHNLGVCYGNGYGVEKNPAEAVKWWLKSADQGNAKAQFSLGYCYSWGLGVEKDDERAKKWVFKALESARKKNMKAVELLALKLISKEKWLVEEAK